MQELDDTDLSILQLLSEDARRTYNEIATAVDLSPPAVSDRINRLKEDGIIRRFTIDVDHELVGGGTNVLIILDVVPNSITELQNDLDASENVDQYFVSADSSFYVFGELPQDRPHQWISETFDTDLIRDIRVKIVTNRGRMPSIHHRRTNGDANRRNSSGLR
jgi:DNA-binding Lrp family transcriptional regulator